jgi:hypothetical protein
MIPAYGVPELTGVGSIAYWYPFSTTPGEDYRVKKLSTLALPALMAVGLLSGCGHDDSKYDRSEVSAEVRSAFAEHQSRTAESVERTGEGFEELQAKIENLLTPDQADIFHSPDFDTVQERFETLNPKTQKALADLYAEYNPESDFYHYEEVSDAGRAIIGANALIIAVATDENDAKAAAEMEQDLIYVDDARHAWFSYDDPDSDAQGTSRDVFMVKVGGEWKLDGDRAFEDFIKPVEE